MKVYSEYQRDRVGWFFGLTGLQLGVLAGGAAPAFGAAHAGAWNAALLAVGGWALLLVVTVVPVHGRTAAGWVWAVVVSTVGGRAGWTAWRSGDSRDARPDETDLPGDLTGIRIHDVPIAGSPATLGVVQHVRHRTWAVTAKITHPGVGWADPDERDRLGSGLAAMLDAACRTELVSEVQVRVCSTPDDGIERDLWLRAHRDRDSPPLVQRIHDDLRRHLTPAAIRGEAFLTVVVTDRRLRQPARDSGRGLQGRGRVMAGLASEMGDQAQGQLGATRIEWLSSDQLAAVCRDGFHPDDHAVRSYARAGEAGGPAGATAPVPNPSRPDARASGEVPRGMWWDGVAAARAETKPRCYAHDAWVSVSSTLLLPTRGARLGDLLPIVAGGQVGERRTLLVAFPIMVPTLADRKVANREWAADLGDGLRAKAQVRPRAQTRADNATARAVDAKLVRGAALSRPYAIATSTVDSGDNILDAARRLDVSIRRAGFGSQRLDLAHDTAFALTCVPLGSTLAPQGDR